MTTQIETGSVVFSRQGRDKGSFFVCVKVLNEREILIADGEVHKLNAPKKKNIKHIKSNGVVLNVLKEKIEENKKVFDSELRKSLRPFNENQTEETDV